MSIIYLPRLARKSVLNMVIIKTVGEIALERMNECSDILAERYLLSVRAIYGATERGTPDHIGSCVLLDYQGKKILVTAAHVIDQNRYTTLYVSGETELVQVTGQGIGTAAPDDDRDKDQMDFFVLPISGEIASKLGGVLFLPESEWRLQDLPVNERCCLALGFPNSRNKPGYASGKKLTPEPFVYTSTLKADPELFKSTGFNMADHYLLDFCSKHSKDADNKITNSIHPKGVSGGGLFLIQDAANPESYRPGTPCSGKLLGILIEKPKGKKVLAYTRMSTIAKALQQT